MKYSSWAGALALSTTLACGSTSSEQPSPSLRGTLNLQAVGHTGAALIAIADDGTAVEHALGKNGELEVELERGRAYTFAFEDQGKRFAKLVFKKGELSKSVLRPSNDDLIIDVGNIEPIAVDPEDCVETPSPDPTTPENPTPGDIIFFTSVRVAGENEAPSEDPSTGVFADSDSDGIADSIDDDDDGDGICDGYDDDPADHDDGDDHGDDGEETDGGEDGGEDHEGRADLPYAVRLEVGDTFALIDAFEGAIPVITDVEMEDGSWRLAELQSGASFEVTQADCDHEGNRDTGRDRIFVSWSNPDGSHEIDHLDLRYCGN